METDSNKQDDVHLPRPHTLVKDTAQQGNPQTLRANQLVNHLARSYLNRTQDRYILTGQEDWCFRDFEQEGKRGSPSTSYNLFRGPLVH